MDVLEQQVPEERDPDLNEEEDIRMEDSREDHWRNFDEYVEDKVNIHDLMWYFYTRDKDE